MTTDETSTPQVNRPGKGKVNLSKRDQERLALAIRHAYNQHGQSITKNEAVQEGMAALWGGHPPIKHCSATVSRYFKKAMELPDPGDNNGVTRKQRKQPAQESAATCTLTAPGLTVTLDLASLPMILHAIAYAIGDKTGGNP